MADLPQRSRVAPSRLREDLLLLVIAALCIWQWNSPLLVPLKLLVVLFHETGHAVAAVLTGGDVVHLRVATDESGEVLSAGGVPLITLNAGYLGSLAWGCLLLYLTRGPTGARAVAGVLAAGAVGVALFWARPFFSFGFVWTLALAGGFGFLARWAPDRVARLVLRTVGVFSVLYALGDITDDVLLRPGSPSDASFLADRTGIPALVWGIGWTIVSIATLKVFGPHMR